MRWIRGTFLVFAIGALAGLSVLNWRAQLQTQHKLDALTAAIAERPTEATPSSPAQIQAPPDGAVPRELGKFTPSPYVIESPDVLLVEATTKDAKTGAVQPLVPQALGGSSVVRPDGTVNLGLWGSVYVAGLTLDQASAAVRKQLTKFASAEMPADKLTVVVDVVAFNSKKYYVITDGGESGEQVVSFPLSGNETVLDALANIGGLANVAGKRNIWIARKRPDGTHQTLPVDWVAITEQNVTATNYQLLSGDRLYVKQAGD